MLSSLHTGTQTLTPSSSILPRHPHPRQTPPSPTVTLCGEGTPPEHTTGTVKGKGLLEAGWLRPPGWGRGQSSAERRGSGRPSRFPAPLPALPSMPGEHLQPCQPSPVTQGYFEQAAKGHGMLPTPSRAQAGPAAVSQGTGSVDLPSSRRRSGLGKKKTRVSEARSAQGQRRVRFTTHAELRCLQRSPPREPESRGPPGSTPAPRSLDSKET